MFTDERAIKPLLYPCSPRLPPATPEELNTLIYCNIPNPSVQARRGRGRSFDIYTVHRFLYFNLPPC